MATRAVIADHQKMFTEGIQAILTEMQFPPIKIVGVAHSLDELNKMTEFPIDLLIMELALTDQHGATYISELKVMWPDIKIIILSNYGEANIVREAFIQGADGYVLKSNHSLELLQCIEFVMEGRTYLAEGLRLAPEYDKQKKSSQREKRKIFEDRYLLKQKLTKREKEILTMIVQYKNNKTIAEELFISDQTVSAHRKRIMKKFGINNTVKLIKFSLDHQLV
ncbi:MAG: response regulator transcription factor [Saprospiraceae bacterium]|jgi:DNA-binding NarL/FixJ family response regulator|nr:response regulator transcription factor [Saprospiraceae bacterium]MBK6666848.1 response regulator transcription factor [Saprospiraceae bacterium]MBK7697452.1 response regulator transcription factor [Saprospiraceae bacterium]MBK8826033.1 response regulator transcription factor [Saprospiraceae bacterium]MBK9582665.1 response regulator transcription factor [Saprospiraceae bacterium]